MKIAMIGQKGIPAISGGVEKHVEELSTRLASAGHEVLVYARPYYTSEKLSSYKGVKIINLPTIKTKNLDAIIHTFLASIDVLFRDVDVIHYHAIGPSSLSFIPRIFKPKAKIIATFHCQDYRHQKWSSFAQAYLKFGEYVACKVPHQTIVVSKTLQEYVAAKYGRRAIYIPNGVTVQQKSKPNLLKKFNVSGKDYILSISRLVRHKGIHYLIEAYNKLSKKYKNLPKLLIVGGSAYTDDYVDYIKKLAANNPNIILAGEQSGDIIGELYSNAAVFVQPSEGEGLSIALLEAMSYGCPVLVSDIAENKEVLPCVGYTFANTDANDLAKQLEKILFNNDSLREVARKNRDHIKKNYNFDLILDQALQLYNTQTSKA